MKLPVSVSTMNLKMLPFCKCIYDKFDLIINFNDNAVAMECSFNDV